MKRLSATQRTAIRTIHDGKGDTVPTRTLAGLYRRGLANYDGEGWASLTILGKRVYEQIMASGDGPEDLKELFAPIFRGVRG